MPQASERVNSLELQLGDISMGIQPNQVPTDMLAKDRPTHLRRKIHLLHTIQERVQIAHM